MRTYPTRQDAKSGLPLQGFVVKSLQISPFKTILDVPPDMAAMTSQDAVVQVRVGVQEALPIHISGGSREILDAIIDKVRNDMKKLGMREVVMVPKEGLGKLDLDLKLDKTTNQQGAVFRILDPSISRWGLSKIHSDYTLPPSLDVLFSMLSAAAHFDWHLYRELDLLKWILSSPSFEKSQR